MALSIVYGSYYSRWCTGSKSARIAETSMRWHTRPIWKGRARVDPSRAVRYALAGMEYTFRMARKIDELISNAVARYANSVSFKGLWFKKQATRSLLEHEGIVRPQTEIMNTRRKRKTSTLVLVSVLLPSPYIDVLVPSWKPIRIFFSKIIFFANMVYYQYNPLHTINLAHDRLVNLIDSVVVHYKA
jgi:hypothetical protein